MVLSWIETGQRKEPLTVRFLLKELYNLTNEQEAGDWGYYKIWVRIHDYVWTKNAHVTLYEIKAAEVSALGSASYAMDYALELEKLVNSKIEDEIVKESNPDPIVYEYAVQYRCAGEFGKFGDWITSDDDIAIDRLDLQMEYVRECNSTEFLQSEYRVVRRPHHEWEVVEGSEITEEQLSNRRKYQTGS